MEIAISDPLCRFGNSDGELTERLAIVDGLKERYRDGLSQNQILANTLEAIRVELT